MELKMSTKTVGSLFIVFLLIQMSTQQFSYSANWGKRKADDNFETECLRAYKFKSLIEDSVINHYDRRILVIDFSII